MIIRDFTEFIQEQGIVGLAVGFILGGAIQKVVAAFVQDILNPILGIALGGGEALTGKTWHVGPIEILWGDFSKVVIDFLVIALVVYYIVRVAKLQDLDKKKEDKKK